MAAVAVVVAARRARQLQRRWRQARPTGLAVAPHKGGEASMADHARSEGGHHRSC